LVIKVFLFLDRKVIASIFISHQQLHLRGSISKVEIILSWKDFGLFLSGFGTHFSAGTFLIISRYLFLL